MAKLGHTSIVIDRLGYGRTVPYPTDGRSVCIGALADSVHQIIADLRSGHYPKPGGSSIDPKRFSRVAVAGYSVGGLITELEEASWEDQSALVLLSWADQGFSTYGTGQSY